MDFDFQKARNSLHQLNNKVAQILAYAELMQLGLTGEKEKERIKLVIAGALECRQITASLMNDMPKTTPARRKLTSVWCRFTVPALMKKPKLKWNFETIFGLIIFGILGCYYVVLLFLFLLIKYL